ncbi:hypothetical protein DFH06DRAFT_1250074 [Mycena polygramma]|nr:hypothetical protein DFH06DRAFT_1250074 [Mycena polygramma]
MPHPALDLRNLDSLPANLRTMAKAACLNDSDSDRHLAKIYHHIQLRSTSTDESNLFLPVFYALLEPTPVDLTTHVGVVAFTEFFPRAIWALKSLNVLIRRGCIPPDTLLDLWPTVFDHMVLQHRLLDAPGASHVGLEIGTFAIHLSLIRNLACTDDSAKVSAIIDGTSGIRVLLSRIWKYFVYHEEFRLLQGVVVDMDLILYGVLGPKAKDIAGLLDGVGGSLSDLTTLIFDHLDLLISGLRLGRNDFPLRAICFLMRLVSIADDIEREAIVSRGIVPKIVVLAIALQRKGPASDAIDQLMSRAISLCHLGIKASLIVPSVRLSVIQALKSGLLWSLAHTMITNARTDDDNRTVKDLLRSLSANLMYYSVIRSLAKPLARLELAGWVPQLQMHECWATWFEVAQDALARKADFDSAPAPLRFCDNVSCDVATARNALRRCSGCESRYYCSVGCQKKDWAPDMNHKAFCPHLQPQGGPALPKKDRAFLLHTIHTGYLRRKSDILHRRAVFMTENHGTGFYTQWNFTKDWNSPGHPVPITIHSLEALQAVYKPATQEMQCAELM